MSEQCQVRYGSSTISYAVNRSRRRKKTVEITLDGQSGVLVAAPETLPGEEIALLVRRRARWILQRATSSMLEAHPRQFISGESVMYLGRRVRMTIVEAEVSKPVVRFRHWSFELVVPLSLHGERRRDAIRKVLTAWYKRKAYDRLKELSHHWSLLLGCDPANILIRDQRQRWASCAQDGTLRFNWRVVMAEPALIDYVVVHELTHLKCQRHSIEFWAMVASAIPDYRLRRQGLQEIGPYLQL